MRRGKPLTRRTRLEPGQPSLARTPLRKRNARRRAARFAVAYESAERVAWYRAQPCAVPGCMRRPCEVAHIVSRAAGGTADQTVSMCHADHMLFHQLGRRTFEAYHKLELETLAAHFAQAWRAHTEATW